MAKLFALQINVTDMDEALDFYCQKLGFKISQSFYPELVELAHVDSAAVTLLLSRVRNRSHLLYPDGTQTVLALATDDLATTIRLLKDKGVEVVHHNPQPFPGGVFNAVRDPSGNVLEFCEAIPEAHREHLERGPQSKPAIAKG